ncbi:MAG: hypothetical protein AAGK09_03480 [Planctomycetota bacterium]
MTIAAIVLLLICLAVIYSSLTSGAGSPRFVEIYFYDEATGELFTAPGTSIPPIDAPSGLGTAVRAHLFSCGECNSSEWTIAYLEKFDEATRDALINRPDSAEAMNAHETGVLIREIDADTWHPLYSEAGMRITDAIGTLCPSGELKPCRP